MGVIVLSRDVPDRDHQAPIGEGAVPRAEFGRLVHDALEHLNDPVYLQTHALTRFVRAESATSGGKVRSPSLGRALGQALLDAIDALRPGPSASPTSRASLSHQILRLRFVEGLEVSAIQDRLAIGRTSYFAEQRQAVEAVASYLWDAWQVGMAIESTEPHRPIPLPTASERPRHNLPTYLTSFVGRGREATEIRQLLTDHRLVTLTGTGGCGKTRLAVETVRGLLGAYPDGVWLAQLAPVADPNLVPSTVASALGVRERSDEPIAASLVRHLQARRALLVLDNCEHLVGACARLADDLLRACPRLRILATSRELLSVDGETVWQVPPLGVPDPGQTISVERLLAAEAVRLFVERAALVQPGFCATRENAAFLAQIVWRLDGLPLAIELAAARTRGLSVEEISEHLGDRFHLLTKGSRTAPQRQQTLRSTIDWSYDLLSEPERALLRRLTVFAGGWSLEAARAVGAGGVVSSVEVIDLLLRLVDKSLVLSDVGHEPTRYRLLETVRQYAAEKLEASGEVGSARDHHLAWYLDLSERAYPELAGRDQRAWATRLDREHDNLRAALDWGLQTDAEMALRMVGSVYRFWRMRGYLAEGRRAIGLTLERAGEASSANGREARARALRAIGLIAQDQMEFRSAIRWHEAALALYRELGDQSGVVKTLPDLGYCLLFGEGDYGLAEDTLRESLRLSRLAGDSRGAGISLFMLALLAASRDELVEAEAFGEESLALLREARDAFNTEIAPRALGITAHAAGITDRARRFLSESLELARELDLPGEIGIDELWLAGVAITEGDLDEAESLARQAARLQLDAAGRGVSVCDLMIFFGHLAAMRGQWERTARLCAAGSQAKTQTAIAPPRLYFFPRREIAADQARAREALGEGAFARAWAEGQAMTLEEAVEYALGERSTDSEGAD